MSLLLLSGSAIAAGVLRQDLDTQLDNCEQQAVSTQANLQCCDAANKAWDAELNKHSTSCCWPDSQRRRRAR